MIVVQILLGICALFMFLGTIGQEIRGVPNHVEHSLDQMSVILALGFLGLTLR